MPVRKELEKHIEARVVKEARRQGILVTKLNLMGFSGMPDRVFWVPGGKPFLIEFKRVGGKLSPLQTQYIEHLRKLGYNVQVHDNSNEAIDALSKAYFAAPATQAEKQQSIVRFAKAVEAASVPKEDRQVRSGSRVRSSVVRPRNGKN